jgi:transcriptional regulator with PAS, ATPase and Fis domain
LRERKEDIPALSHYFLQKYSKETRKHFTEITKEAQEILLAYGWPGNVRELANVIERAIVLGRGPKITLEEVPERIATRETEVARGILSFREGVNAAKKELILKALSRTQGNRLAAAKALGLHEKYLLQLIKTLQIK